MSLTFSTVGALLYYRLSLQSAPVLNRHLQQPHGSRVSLQLAPLHCSTVILSSYRVSLHGSRVSLQSAPLLNVILTSYRISLHGSRMSLQSAPLLNSHLQKLQGQPPWLQDEPLVSSTAQQSSLTLSPSQVSINSATGPEGYTRTGGEPFQSR